MQEVGMCPLCNEEKKLEKHHTSYYPEKVERMCHKCHINLHKKHPELCPSREDSKKWYGGRTYVNIKDELHSRAKAASALEGKTLNDFINDTMRVYLQGFNWEKYTVGGEK